MQHVACRLSHTGSSGLISDFLACAHQLHLGPCYRRGHITKLSNPIILARLGCPKALEIQTSTEFPQSRECQLLEASTKQEGEGGKFGTGGFPFSERWVWSWRLEKNQDSRPSIYSLVWAGAS